MPENTPKNNRKDSNIRRANRVIQTRSAILMVVMGVVMFAVLFAKLYSLQIRRHEELQSRAVSQQTRSTVVSANRGTIYDRNGNVLAISATAETVFLSPLELEEQLNDKENPAAWTREGLAAALSEILEVSEESILKKMDRTYSQYEVLKLRAEEDVADRVRQYVNENKIHGVYLVTDAKRYYPYGSLAAHVIGFVGDDNTGLYGLEAEYESQLEGETGLVITAKDNAGNDMLYEYEQYFDAHNGNDIVTTLDATVQYYLEKGLEGLVDQFLAENGAAGVVLNAKTGAVLAMASYPNFDLNHFSDIADPGLQQQIDSGEATLGDMQLKQWRNKCLNDTYEPGSTSKILTLSAALEEGVIDLNTTVNCGGSITVSGSTIYCSNKAGHGTYGLRLGTAKFYQYMRSFGLLSGTDIDLAGEATGIFIPEPSFTQLDLACYAFGQNFNVTPVALIAAQAACINGGYLHSPYLVEQILDDQGNVVFQHDTTPVRQVISEETSAKVRDCLEYVVAQGTGKNGQVAGYRIGGKTGTADKGNSGDVVVSFLCFAPADDPEIIMLLTLDTPSRNTGTYVSGGQMVAPMASTVMGEILPYLGMEPTYSAEELLGIDTTVPNAVDMAVDEAKAALQEKGFTCRIVGEGDTITDQTPAGGAIIPRNSTVVLYAGAEKPDTPCVVPNLLGRSPADANTTATNAGLLIRFTGATATGSGSIRVLGQSEEAGTEVAAGTVITVRLGDTSVLD